MGGREERKNSVYLIKVKEIVAIINSSKIKDISIYLCVCVFIF